MVKIFLTLIYAFFLIYYSPASALKKFIKIFLPDDVSLTAELAITDEERQLGLMFREKMNWDQAMLFLFEEEDRHSFWMKNMVIPLDILWLDRNKKIIHMETHVPPCKKYPCPSYVSPLPSLYVLELKAGSVERYKLKLSDKIEFVLPEIDFR